MGAPLHRWEVSFKEPDRRSQLLWRMSVISDSTSTWWINPNYHFSVPLPCQSLECPLIQSFLFSMSNLLYPAICRKTFICLHISIKGQLVHIAVVLLVCRGTSMKFSTILECFSGSWYPNFSSERNRKSWDWGWGVEVWYGNVIIHRLPNMHDLKAVPIQ